MIEQSDWADEDTEVGPNLEERRMTAKLEPSYELIWVEEDGLGMVLRVRRIGTQ
jgi:hypothetical protein